MKKVFIACSQADSEVARRLSEVIHRNELLVFLDQDTLVSGKRYSEQVVSELRLSDAVIVLLSEHSKRSKWVEAELQDALALKNIVIPILLDDEATQNWVWPLVANRTVRKLDDDSDYSKIAEELKHTMLFSAA